MYPALAVAEALVAEPVAIGGDQATPSHDHSKTDGRQSVVYIGSVGGMEREIVARESSLPFRALPAAAVRGRGPGQLIRGSFTTLAGTVAAFRLLRNLRPGAILGTGGYVCVPLFVAARLARVPTLIYLPDVVPGLAVRFLARIATQVACNVEDSRRYFPSVKPAQFVITGYPVRPELFDQDKAACRRAFGLASDLPVLLVYGGSRGARSINRAIEALLPDLLEQAQIIHVCGREGDEVWLRTAAKKLDPRQQARYHLHPYLEGAAQAHDTPTLMPTMVRAFGAADLAICRSGASTLAELPAAGLPAVLVPYPYVHQDENADYLAQRGAAVKVTDDAMLGAGQPCAGELFTQVTRLLTHKHERQQMAEQSRALARPHAAQQLGEAVLNLAKGV